MDLCMISCTNNPQLENLNPKCLTFDNILYQAIENIGYHPKTIPYVVSNKEVNAFRRTTPSYVKYIGVVPVTPFLSQRRNIIKTIVSTFEHTLAHIFEDLVELTLREIDQTFYLAPNTLVIDVVTPLKNIHYDNQDYLELDTQGSQPKEKGL